MANGYIVAAETDIAVARVIAEGFDLDVISAGAPSDDATAAIHARAGNVGFVLSAAAAEDANFTALAQSLASQLETAQLILVAPEARAAFPYLPPTWPSMSLEQARERARALCEQRHPGGAPADEPTQAQPAPPAHVHEAPASEETAAEETPVERTPVKEAPVEMAPSPQDAEPDLTSADAPVNEGAAADTFSGESEALDGALPAEASAEDDRAGAASETFAADRDRETPVAGAAAPEAAEPAPPVADRIEEAQPLEAAEQAPPAPAPIEPAAPPKAAEPPAPAPPPPVVAASAPASGGANDDVKTSVGAPARAPARTNGQDAAGKPAETPAPPRARAAS